MDVPNLDLLQGAAEKLRPLLTEMVFEGGCATGLLISDPSAAPVRRTYDVDSISEIASHADYAVFSERLCALGFGEDSREGALLCRWPHGELMLEVMPLEASILGFSNRWYPYALRTAVEVELPGNLKLKATTAPYFLGTKIEAFRGRSLSPQNELSSRPERSVVERPAVRSLFVNGPGREKFRLIRLRPRGHNPVHAGIGN